MGFGVHHVSPFMDLICQNAQYDTENNSPFVSLTDPVIGSNKQPYGYEKRHRIARTSISFNKTMLGNILGINMMHPESPDKSWTNNRSRKLTPGITSPMQHPRYKINQELCDNEASNNTYGVLIIVRYRVVDQLRPEAQCEDEEAQLEHEFTRRVTILPKNLAIWFCLQLTHMFYSLINSFIRLNKKLQFYFCMLIALMNIHVTQQMLSLIQHNLPKQLIIPTIKNNTDANHSPAQPIPSHIKTNPQAHPPNPNKFPSQQPQQTPPQKSRISPKISLNPDIIQSNIIIAMIRRPVHALNLRADTDFFCNFVYNLQQQSQPVQNLQLHMTSLERISHFMENFGGMIATKSEQAFQELFTGLAKLRVDDEVQQQHNEPVTLEIIDHKDSKEEKFQGLEQLELIQSRAVPSKNAEVPTEKNKKKRIKQIEQQKKKIADELRELDEEIQEIKGKGSRDKLFKKHEKIQKDENAQRNAELLIKQLKNQRKQIENRKKQQFEKSLQEMQKEQQQRRKRREEEILRLKQERRLAILQRMQQQKKRKEQRRLIEMQSNQLIIKLKKQEQLQKIASLAPSQVLQVDQKKKMEKKNIFNIEQIEEHQRKYREHKMKSKKQKQQRAQSLKVNKQLNSHKYTRNVWIEQIQEQEQKRKQQQKQNEKRRKDQLQKRLKYGELVKNIFLPKKKDKQNHQNPSDQIRQSNTNHQVQSNPAHTQQKPRTPQDVPTLPKIKNSKNRTQNSKMFRQQSLPGIRNSSKDGVKRRQEIKEFDPQEEQKQMIKKLRQIELRKQTKQRLKKLEGKSLNKAVSQQQRVKYKNYLGEVKIKKDEANDWKRIISNDKLTQQQKYQQIIKKATDLEAKARKKQDKNAHKQADEDAVNLYIGSIQAKLALLQKF